MPARETHDLVATAAHTLARCLEACEILISKLDARGSGFISGSAVGSRPPWNAQAAYALLISWQEIRVLEAQIRQRAGLAEVVRGGSAGNTAEALEFLVMMAPTLPREDEAYLAHRLEAMAETVFALPAMADLPAWREIPMRGPPDCPWCGTPNLRLNELAGIVACLYTRCPSSGEGRREWAQVTMSEGKIMWRWRDGTVQP